MTISVQIQRICIIHIMRIVINIISILNSRNIYIRPIDSDTVSRFIIKKRQGINTMDIFPESTGKISTLKNYAFEIRMSHFCKTLKNFCGKLKSAATDQLLTTSSSAHLIEASFSHHARHSPLGSYSLHLAVISATI